MSKSNTTENDVLKAILKGTDPSWRAGATLYVALHSSDPGEDGNQTTNEVAFSNYTRQPITKSSGWTDNGSSFSNVALIQFSVCGNDGATARYASIGTAETSTGQILYSGQLSADLTIAINIQAQFAIGAITITED